MHTGITLFIAVTPTASEARARTSSFANRARSIAAWFRKRASSSRSPTKVFGETSLKVSTADNVDEVRNRRVD